MSPPPKKPSRPGDLSRPMELGEPLPVPEVVEKDTDTSWALFQALQEDPSRVDFAETRRSGPGPLEATPSSPSTRPPAGPAAPLPGPTLDDAMFEARRNNRVCPLPPYWNRLYGLLPNKTAKEPLPPVPAAAWGTTPALNKRICLRNQLEWAHAQGALVQVFAYLRALPEDKWQHMGD